MKNTQSIFMLITLITSTTLGTLSPVFIFPTWANPPDYVVINEVLYDPMGTDLGYEFMELYNPTSQNIDLSNWTIESGGTSFAKVTTIPQGTVIGANTYFVIGEEQVENASLKVAKLEFQNGGSETDGVRIKDNGGKVIDTLLYDEPNNNSLPDDTGNVGTKFAPDAGSGSSLGRDKYSSDTNDCLADFKEHPEPTPGVINEQEGSGPPPEEYAETIRLSELLPNPTGSDTEDEFIELENFGSEDVDLVGWILEDASGNQYIIDQEDFTSTIIIPNGFFAVFREISGISLNNTGSEEARIYQPDENLLDSVAYQGTVAEASAYARDIGEFKWTTTPTAGAKNVFTSANEPPQAQAGADKEAIVGQEITFDGSDSQDPNADTLTYKWRFGDDSETDGVSVKHVYNLVGTYQAALTVSDGQEEDSDQLEVVVGEKSTDPNIDYPDTVIISEFLPDPEGDDAEGEFIELKNIGKEKVDLSFWKLSDSTTRRFTITQSTFIEAGKYKSFSREETGISLNNSGGDLVVLYQPNDTAIDKVEYQDSESAMSYALFSDGFQWTKMPTPGLENEYLSSNTKPMAVIGALQEGRVGAKIIFDASDSEDVDGDELEFTWDFGDGKGGAGQQVEYSYLKSGTFVVTLTVSDVHDQDLATHSIVIRDYDFAEEIYISELLPDPAGSDAEEEYIELTSKEGRVVELAGWSIADEKTIYFFPEDTVIAKDGILLIMRPESEITLNNDQDKVTLFNPRNEVIDELAYENASPAYAIAKDESGKIFVTSSPTPGQENILAAENGEEKDGDEQDEEQISEDDDSNAPTKNQDKTEESETTSIGSVKNLAKGKKVKILGSVVVLPGVLGSQYFYVFDGKSGIQIYSSKKLFPDLKIGNEIQVLGKVSEARNEKRINISQESDIKIIGQADELAPLDLTGKKLDEENEGSLVQIDGNIIDRKSTSLVLDSTGVETEVSIKKGANISTKELADGQLVSIVGVVSQSKDKYILLPRSQEDIMTPEVLGELKEGAENTEKKPDDSVEKNQEQKNHWLDFENRNNVLIILGVVAGVILIGGVIVLTQPKAREMLKKKIEELKSKFLHLF